MSHLHPERLAALADGEPTAAEATHLSSCSACAHEIAAHRRLLMLAWQEREALSAPLASWDTLAESLRDEGLLRATPSTAGRGGGTVGGGGVRSPWWVQAAAAVVILAGGMHIGRMTVATSGETTAAVQQTANSRLASNTDTSVAFSSPAFAGGGVTEPGAGPAPLRISRNPGRIGRKKVESKPATGNQGGARGA